MFTKITMLIVNGYKLGVDGIILSVNYYHLSILGSLLAITY